MSYKSETLSRKEAMAWKSKDIMTNERTTVHPTRRPPSSQEILKLKGWLLDGIGIRHIGKFDKAYALAE